MVILQLDLATHTTLAEVRQFPEAYAHVGRTLRRFSHWKLGKCAERGLLRAYLRRTTGLSRAQVARLIAIPRPRFGLISRWSRLWNELWHGPVPRLAARLRHSPHPASPLSRRARLQTNPHPDKRAAAGTNGTRPHFALGCAAGS